MYRPVETRANGRSGEAKPAGGDGERSPPGGAHIRTFLIADVRGYTRFTQERGDEEAGRLAATFAEQAREVIEACGGDLLELRGDEALSVFLVAPQALYAVNRHVKFVRHAATFELAATEVGEEHWSRRNGDSQGS